VSKQANGRSGGPDRRRTGPERSDRRRRIAVHPGASLPKWVREEILRSTPKERREPAIAELTKGLSAYAEERYRQAVTALRKAKGLAPRAATIRELLGLASYHAGEWEEGLRELRTFRRLTGDTTHMAVELDCLRGLGRSGDVDKTWETFRELGGSREADDEARVVYASHLLDSGRVAEAWQVVKPGRLSPDAPPSALRRWAVAAKVASEAGDADAARRLVKAIRDADPDVPWLADLEQSIG
jgi:hypothetical protein